MMFPCCIMSKKEREKTFTFERGNLVEVNREGEKGTKEVLKATKSWNICKTTIFYPTRLVFFLTRFSPFEPRPLSPLTISPVFPFATYYNLTRTRKLAVFLPVTTLAKEHNSLPNPLLWLKSIVLTLTLSKVTKPWLMILGLQNPKEVKNIHLFITFCVKK